VTNKGFKMCVEDSLLLEEESEDAVESETVDLNENELAELPDGEREHAQTKYQQKREEVAAEVEAATEMEKRDTEMQAVAEAAALLESDVQEIEGVELDADDFALPDLTTEA